MIPTRHRVPAAGLLAIAVVLAACGAAGSPGGTSSPSASSPALPGPTRWPGQVARAVIALGSADNEIGRASTDLQRSIAEEDLALMRRAADGLAGLTVLLGRVDQIEAFELTRPLAARYRVVLPALIEASTELRDAIDAADAARIEQANIKLARALALYVTLRPDLSTLVAQALEQQRQLLN